MGQEGLVLGLEQAEGKVKAVWGKEERDLRVSPAASRERGCQARA